MVREEDNDATLKALLSTLREMWMRWKTGVGEMKSEGTVAIEECGRIMSVCSFYDAEDIPCLLSEKKATIHMHLNCASHNI